MNEDEEKDPLVYGIVVFIIFQISLYLIFLGSFTV